MPLPPLTHLQFAIIDELVKGETSGRQLRKVLASKRIKKSGPAFYQLMARMEDAKLVKGRYEKKIVEGQMIKERKYKATAKGNEAWNANRDFYFSRTATEGLIYA